MEGPTCTPLAKEAKDMALDRPPPVEAPLKEHEDRYRALLSNVEEGKVFKRGDVVIWQCS